MKIKVLASGSKGNSYILKASTGSLLLEAGIPFKDIQKGLDFNLSDILGALVTHEHKDHSKSILEVMKAGIDIYLSEGTIEALNLPINTYYRAIPAHLGAQINFGDFTVLSFETEHDAKDPRGFLIQYKPTKEKLLFLTDSFYCKYKFKDLNYIMIECNYIKETLDRNIELGYINEAMKPRLLRSHFNLENVKEFLKANDLSQCNEIILLHLSDSNSAANRMIKEIYELTGIKPKIAEAGLEVELEMYPY